MCGCIGASVQVLLLGRLPAVQSDKTKSSDRLTAIHARALPIPTVRPIGMIRAPRKRCSRENTNQPKSYDGYRATALYSSNPPAPTGAFYFFNDAQSTKNAIRYLAPSPTSTANLEPLFRSKITQLFPLTAKPDHYILKLYRYKYSSTQLPNTSLPIAITDAIGSSKSHRYLMPSFWDLIEA